MSIKVEGRVVIEELRGDEWVEVARSKNRVLDGGLHLVLERLCGDTSSKLTHIAVGTDDAETVDTQTSLNNELTRKEISDKIVSGTKATLSTTFGAGEAVGVWKECALANNDIIFNRVLIDYTKSATAISKVKFTISVSRG
jgi:hypothetical protein